MDKYHKKLSDREKHGVGQGHHQGYRNVKIATILNISFIITAMIF